ncbi:MAG: DUF1571 domain-containing protein [Planctomycetes bacterium]|nr:DUF1571 domain-containing protein [Planctomycetota bacterium]
MRRDSFRSWAATVLAVIAAADACLVSGPTAMAQAPAPGAVASNVPAAAAPAQPATNEHPLAPALRIAYDGVARIERDVKDYSCTLVKREQIDGVVGEHQYIFCKIRHKPFSVYMYFLGPDDIKGREVIYVEGANDGKLLAHEEQGLRARFGTVALLPNSFLAMKGQRYPITMTGIQVMIRRLAEVAEKDSKFGECDVKFYQGAKINGRVCTCIQVTHPVPRRQFEFHLARVFIDDELQVPARYEAYEWPKQPGGAPVLLEEYTYLNMKLNNGFTDTDFDKHNPTYKFIRK